VASRPREVALAILSALFEREPAQAIPKAALRSYTLAAFQEEGVVRVRELLRRRGGAVLADSVGLGKTYIALALIEEALREGEEVVVVVPAAVRSLWRQVLRRLASETARPRLLSHTQLALGRANAARTHPTLVVVDEAHRFRNPRTLRHAALARLTRPGTRVLLITATPVNNGPEDFLHLLRLFASDDAFRDVGVPSLRDAFEERGGPGTVDSAGITAVVRAVVVRRTRALVRDRFGTSSSGPRFPDRDPPHLVRYDRPDLPDAVRAIARLELAPYSLERDSIGTGRGASGLIRLNLLKRLDSSPAAFEASLTRLGRLLRATLDAARVGRVLAPGPGVARGRDRDADPLQLTLVELVADPARPDVDLPSLMASVERDLAVIGGLRTSARTAAGQLNGGRGARNGGEAPDPDPKLAALLALLDGLRGEKAVVFTEYRDTAEALWRALAPRHRVGRVDGVGAWLGLRPAGRRLVVERFAPRANGRPTPPALEAVDVLVATDVLAEGVNLQDARHVVSYDLPWNPVRLLQRIGRVDRLGSPHDVIVPHLFAPEHGLEEMLGLTRRLRRKLGHIAATVGAEQADDLLDRLVLTGAPGEAHAADLRETIGRLEAARPLEPPDDPMEALRTLWVRLRNETGRDGGPQEIPVGPGSRRSVAAGTAVPLARITVPGEHPAACLDWIVLAEHAGTPTLLEIGRDGAIHEFGARSVAAISHALQAHGTTTAGTSARATSDPVPFREIREYLARSRPATNGPPRLAPHDPGRRLARRIRAEMARAGSGLDPAALRCADRLLARLSTPLDPGAETRVRALLGQLDGSPVRGMLAEAEAALDAGRAPARRPLHGSPSSPGATRLRAALRILPGRWPRNG